VLPARARMTPKLTLGYREATALHDTPLLAAGTRVRAHEFHRTDSEPVYSERPAWQLADGTQTGWAARGVLASYLHLHWGRAVRRRNPPSPDRPRSPPSRPMSQDHRWRSRSGRGIALGSTSGPRPPTGSPNPSPGRRRIHDWCVSTKSTLYVHTIRQLQERGAEPTVGVCPPAMRHKQSPGWRLATPSARVSRPACGASWPISNDWCPASHRAATSSRWPAEPACSPPWASNISSALSAG
jgi:hypothetical protein